MKPKAPKQIIFIGGYLNSGKSTYSQKITTHMKIGISGIVRDLLNGVNTRKELQDSAHLDKKVIARVIQIIEGRFHPKSQYIFEGIRQSSIFTGIVNYLHEKEIEYEVIWLDVPIEICKRRFLLKNDGKENISFEEAFERDANLGLLELERYWKEHSCTIVKNY